MKKKEFKYGLKKFSYFVLVPVIALLPFIWGVTTNKDMFTGDQLADNRLCLISLNVLPNCEPQK